jgi:hypothetical protein
VVFDFLKKKSDAIAPPTPPLSPVSKFDAKLPPLPALPPLPGVPVTPAAPPMPPKPVIPTPRATPTVPPALQQPKPAPRVEPPKQTLPPMTFSQDKPRMGDIAPISVPREPQHTEAVRAMPKPTPPPVAPVFSQPPKLENSKLAKALEELSALDLDLPDVELKAMKHDSKPVAPVKKEKVGPRFVAVEHFDEGILELRTLTEHLHELQAKNEKLGVIETHTKQQLDALINQFDYVQKHLLLIDEKLFKVN